MFFEEEDPSSKTYFSEIVASISDCKFSRDGRYIISRDYLNVKVRCGVWLCDVARSSCNRSHGRVAAVQIWDMAMESRPLHVIHIHEHLRPKLSDLYENDCIFDKYEVCINATGR